jgi:tetratricopeptide (TPR) repeat protein
MFNTQTGAGGTNVPTQPSAGGQAVNLSKFSRTIKWLLYATVFLLPVFFLPWTTEVREFNKQSLLFLLVVVMLAVWVIKILTTRSLSWVKTPLDYVLLGYLGIYLISSSLSIDKVSSFLGYYNRFTGSFLAILSLVVLYFIIVNNVRSGRLLRNLTRLIMASGAVVLVYSFLQMIGVHLIRFDFTKVNSFNPIGSMVGISLFAGLMIVLIQWLWLNAGESKFKKISFTVLTLVGFAVMFLVDYWASWVVLGVALVAFIAVAMSISGNRLSPTWFWKPLVALVVAILFISFQFLPALSPRKMVNTSLPVEIQLSTKGNMTMVKNALSEKPVLGYGPGTTGIAFGNIKPESINKSIVWSLTFDRSSSEIANIAVETGLLGLLAFEAAAILFLIYALFFLIKRTEHPDRMYAMGFFLGWLFIYISHFFYFFNTTFYFLYWLFLGLFMAVAHWRDRQEETPAVSFNNAPRATLSWMFASLLILAVLIVTASLQISLYAAEVSYTSGIKELNKPEPNFEKAGSHFASAIRSNQYRDVYYLAFAQNSIFLASQEAAKKDADVRKFQGLVADAISGTTGAVQFSPAKANNWSARAQIYSQLKTLAVSGTNDLIIDSWKTASERDRKNPAILVQLALAYADAAETIDEKILGTGLDSDGDGLSDEQEKKFGSDPFDSDSNDNGVSDGVEVLAGFNPAGVGRLSAAVLQEYIRIDNDMLRKAEEALKKAIALKDDLPDSYVALARIYERQQKLDLARQQLEDAIKTGNSNIDVHYELGRVHFNQKKFADAEKIFNDIIRSVDAHANAHYSLGLIHLQRNDHAKALVQFEKTREIAGPNVELEKVINELKEMLGK